MHLSICSAAMVLGIASAGAPDGGTGSGMQAVLPKESGSDNLYVYVVDTWQAPYAQQILDLEYRDYPEALLFVSDLDNRIFVSDPNDGTFLGSVDRPAGLNGFGTAWYDGEYHVNGWNSDSIYRSDGSGTWSSYHNPAGMNGRGLEVFSNSGGSVWESMSDGSTHQVLVFDTDGTNIYTIDLPGIPGQISGVSVYPLTTAGNDPPSGVGLIVCCYDDPNFYSFIIVGTTAYPDGPTPVPLPVNTSYGLASAYWSRGTFFWSYQGTDGEYCVSEIYFGVNSLEQATWASIKAQFE